LSWAALGGILTVICVPFIAADPISNEPWSIRARIFHAQNAYSI
jgi:hypothetical protein